jgi:hypothetical protein
LNFSFKKLDSKGYIAHYDFHDSKQLFGSLVWVRCSELGLAALAKQGLRSGQGQSIDII